MEMKAWYLLHLSGYVQKTIRPDSEKHLDNNLTGNTLIITLPSWMEWQLGFCSLLENQGSSWLGIKQKFMRRRIIIQTVGCSIEVGDRIIYSKHARHQLRNLQFGIDFLKLHLPKSILKILEIAGKLSAACKLCKKNYGLHFDSFLK